MSEKTKPSQLFVKFPEPSIWDDICRKEKEDSSPFSKYDAPEIVDFNPAIVTPVFYGKLFAKINNVDVDVTSEFDPAKGHPASVGHAFIDEELERTNDIETTTLFKAEDPAKCSSKEYMQRLLFPVLLPGLREMLFQARRERCFQRKRTKFNACDFLTEWLFNNNPRHPQRMVQPLSVLEIPFCKEFSADHPREALPLSLLLSDEQAATIIQSHWRGFLVRKEPEVASLRTWQREWNEMNQDVRNKMSNFWRNQGLNDGRSAPSEDSGEGDDGEYSFLSSSMLKH